jgi:hypothetical protein
VDQLKLWKDPNTKAVSTTDETYLRIFDFAAKERSS